MGDRNQNKKWAKAAIIMQGGPAAEALAISSELDYVMDAIKSADCGELGFWIMKMIDLYEIAKHYGHLARDVTPPVVPSKDCEKKREVFLWFGEELRASIR